MTTRSRHGLASTLSDDGGTFLGPVDGWWAEGVVGEADGPSNGVSSSERWDESASATGMQSRRERLGG
jgi:hypothetical protein